MQSEVRLVRGWVHCRRRPRGKISLTPLTNDPVMRALPQANPKDLATPQARPKKKPGKKKRGSDVAQGPIDYAGPAVPREIPPAWQRRLAWALIAVAIPLVLCALYISTEDLRSVLFMPY